MQNPLDSIPSYARGRLKQIQKHVQNAGLFCEDEIAFSDGFILSVLEDSTEYKTRMNALTKDFELLEEFMESKHPWATEALTKSYWRHLNANEPHNAIYCAIRLGIAESQVNIDLVKAQMYVFLEEIGLEGKESLAEDMAERVIQGENPEDVFVSYIKNSKVEFEKAESETDRAQQNDEWVCEYCGAIFDSFEEALCHEKNCEMCCDEDDEYDKDIV